MHPRRLLPSIAITCLTLALGSRLAHAATIAIEPARDNTLFQNDAGDTSDGAGDELFSSSTREGGIRRAVLAFDLSGLPATAVVDSVALSLQVSRTELGSTTLRTFTLHRLLKNWGEGTSTASQGQGAPAMPGDATWLYTFYPNLPWTMPGGDFDATASASLPVGGLGTYMWKSSTMAQDVQAWIMNPATNFGWLLQGPEEIAGSAHRFFSREAATPSQRPRLIVYYSDQTPTLPITWGSLQRRYR